MPFDDEPLNVEELAGLQHLDEQIDQGLHAPTLTQPNGKHALDPELLRDVQAVYQPRAEAFQRGLDRVWGRLEARGAALAEPAQPPIQSLPLAGAPPGPRTTRPIGSVRRHWTARLSVLVAAVVLLGLLAALAYGLVLVRRPGTTAATPLPGPSASAATPGPSPSPTSAPGGVTSLISIHMIDETTGWAQGANTNGESQIWHTTDGGAHWQKVTPSTLAEPSGELTEYYLNASVGWVVAQMDKTVVFRTTDSGQTWQSASLNADYSIRQITFATPRLGWLLSTEGATGNEVADLFRTTDGGASWSKIADTGSPPNKTGTIPFDGKEKTISFLNASTGWLTEFSNRPDFLALYVTHDGGVNWQHQELPVPPGADISGGQNTVRAPTFFNAQDGILPVLVPAPAGNVVDVYVTHNGGASWQPTALLKVNYITDTFSDASHGWVTDGTTLFSTSDGGQHWTQLPASSVLQQVQRLDFVSSQIGWAISQPSSAGLALLKTTDGGKTWTVVTPQL
jgi:photosystem II stability/assembly factor-like uncharacterized protein